MQPQFSLMGIILLFAFVAFTRLLSVHRTVRSIKAHMERLQAWRNEAIQKGVHGVNYEEAHTMLYGIQKRKLEIIQESFFGSVYMLIWGNKRYETTSKRQDIS